jgi:hypothetical protein
MTSGKVCPMRKSKNHGFAFQSVRCVKRLKLMVCEGELRKLGKGYEEVFVQELIFRTDNVLYHKEKFSSPSQQKTFLAELPAGYQGQFGPQLKAFIWVLYFAVQVSEPKIVELLFSAGICISGAEVSKLLIKEQESLHEEKAEIVHAGLESSPWQ